MQRVIAQETGISTDAQRNMTDDQWRAFHAWFTVENTLRPILFDKERGSTAGQIAAKCALTNASTTSSGLCRLPAIDGC